MIRARDADLIVSFILFCVGIYVACGAVKYGFAEEGVPGAGFFPFWVGGGIIVTSALNFVRLLRGRMTDFEVPVSEVTRVVIASVAMALFVLASTFIGMLAAVFLLMLGIGGLFGPRNASFYARLLGVVAAATALLWLIFAKLLAVPLV